MTESHFKPVLGLCDATMIVAGSMEPRRGDINVENAMKMLGQTPEG